MQVVRALTRGQGDYVHPEENVQIIDEATGEIYDLIVHGTAEQPGDRKSVRIYIPERFIQNMISADEYYILDLSNPINDQEAHDRVNRFQRR